MRSSNASCRRQRGVSLVEAMVAFAVMGLGMLAVLGIQSTLRFEGDVAKQRAEAVRLAQEAMEGLRSFSVMSATEGFLAFDDIETEATRQIDDFTITNTSYNVAVNVINNVDPTPEGAAVTVTVSWKDRRAAVDEGPNQSVVLTSMIAGINPALSGSLSLRPNGLPTRNPFSRSAEIPIQAKDLGDGRSIYKPGANSTVAYVFNNTTGVITSQCVVPLDSTTNTLNAAHLTTCTTPSGFYVAGLVRFATAGTVSAAIAENPVGSSALNLDLQVNLVLSDNSTVSYPCVDDAPVGPITGIEDVAYFCFITPEADTGKWSGRLVVAPVGWTLGTADTEYRVCRYSANYDGKNGISNIEHPLDYVDVDRHLPHQNFLVIRGDNTCPSDVPVNPAQGDLVNSNTVEHAPTPTSSS